MADNTTSAQDRKIGEAEMAKEYVPIVGELLDIIEDLDSQLTAVRKDLESK